MNEFLIEWTTNAATVAAMWSRHAMWSRTRPLPLRSNYRGSYRPAWQLLLLLLLRWLPLRRLLELGFHLGNGLTMGTDKGRRKSSCSFSYMYVASRL